MSDLIVSIVGLVGLGALLFALQRRNFQLERDRKRTTAIVQKHLEERNLS